MKARAVMVRSVPSLRAKSLPSVPSVSQLVNQFSLLVSSYILHEHPISFLSLCGSFKAVVR